MHVHLHDALLAYLHFAALIAVFACLVAEFCLLRLDPVPLRALGRLDGAYGASAVLALVTGFLRAFLGVKGWAFYASNPFFHAKLGTFVLVALVSILPTVQFIRWGRARRADAAFLPEAEGLRRVRRLVSVQLALLALVPLFATLMARGLRP